MPASSTLCTKSAKVKCCLWISLVGQTSSKKARQRHHLILIATRRPGSGNMKAVVLVENDFLVTSLTFYFLNWFSLPTEVRVCRNQTNWFQISIPLTTEQSWSLCSIDLQSIQTQLMCLKLMGRGGQLFSFFFLIIAFFLLQSLKDNSSSSLVI